VRQEPAPFLDIDPADGTFTVRPDANACAPRWKAARPPCPAMARLAQAGKLRRMSDEIHETQLPGVGVRHDFVTRDGDRVAVVAHRSGDRELVVYEPEDPDAARVALRLGPDDAQALSQMLGGSRIADEQGRQRQPVGGASIDWLEVEAGSPLAGRPLGALVPDGASAPVVAALIRGGQPLPTPPAEFVAEPGDVLVLVGSDAALARLGSWGG
jgi:TrkA domain protein